ncbi:helix-turn-helix domain-containing protein, partial [Salmonella enterica subsp. enterica]|nr:helix-turn-helix domain-containing protein [Salmonella enterica subsp. enterica]
VVFSEKNIIRIGYPPDIEVGRGALVILNASATCYIGNDNNRFYCMPVALNVLNEYVEYIACAQSMQTIKKYRENYMVTPSTDSELLISILKDINSPNYNCHQKKSLIFFVLSFFSDKKIISFILSANSSIKNKVRAIINRDLQVKWRLSQVASMLYLSPGTLKNRLKCEETSWTKVLTDCKMQKATELFLVGNESIQQVAASCGYKSVSFFIRLFRGHFGVTPHEFIKKYRAL